MSEPEQLADGLVRLGTDYVNWYLVADDEGVVMVDAGVPGYRPQLEPGLKLLGRGLAELRAILLTHSDSDHTGIAGAVNEEIGLPIYIHADDQASAANPKSKKTDGSMLPALRRPGLWKLFGHFARNGALRPPKLTETSPVGDGEVLQVPGRPTAVATPGHTPGHVVFHFPAHGALFVGDAIYTWNPLTGGRGPQVGPRAFNVSTPRARESLAAIEGLDADLLLPGHGDPWTEGPAAAVAAARSVPDT